jgi:alpha-tubulin suppressor-like RCC1 family protein
MKKVMSCMLLVFSLMAGVNAQCFKSISTGYDYTLLIKKDGTLWASGNYSNSNSATYFVQIGTDNNWNSVSAGYFHSFALKNDGSLWAWGKNTEGQLGDGTNTNRDAPIKIGLSIDWAEIHAGYGHSLARKKDGTIWAWGDNSNGQLGDGTTTNRSVPTKIGSDNSWTMLSVKGEYNLGMKSNGSLWAWGENANGRLGLGAAITTVLSPQQIGTTNDWKSISAGWQHVLAIKKDGSLWAWGFGLWGQIGNGTSAFNNYLPLKIGTDTTWKSVTAGGFSSMALRKDGTRWGWGQNLGELGNGSGNSFSNIPVKLENDTDWDFIFSGHTHFYGVKTNGSLLNWGVNLQGQLGDSTTTTQYFPRLVACSPSVSVKNIGEIIQIYPNPTDGTVTIDGFDLSNASLKIYNSIGKKVKEDNLNHSTVSLSELPAGIYWLHITSKDKQFIKEIIKF